MNDRFDDAFSDVKVSRVFGNLLALSLLETTQEINRIMFAIAKLFEDEKGNINMNAVRTIARSLSAQNLFTLYTYMQSNGSSLVNFASALQCEYEKRFTHEGSFPENSHADIKGVPGRDLSSPYGELAEKYVNSGECILDKHLDKILKLLESDSGSAPTQTTKG